MFKKRHLLGMTLNEILIVVMIVSMLGTLGVVTYVRAYEKNLGNQAIAVIRLIRAAERVYYLDNNRYSNSLVGATFPCGSNLITLGYMSCPNPPAPPRLFEHRITVAGPGGSYNTQALRMGTGRYAGRIIRLDVTMGAVGETVTWAGTWPAEWIPSN